MKSSLLFLALASSLLIATCYGSLLTPEKSRFLEWVLDESVAPGNEDRVSCSNLMEALVLTKDKERTHGVMREKAKGSDEMKECLGKLESLQGERSRTRDTLENIDEVVIQLMRDSRYVHTFTTKQNCVGGLVTRLQSSREAYSSQYKQCYSLLEVV
jgi:hypothetical protein